jgi:hypothetical protein
VDGEKPLKDVEMICLQVEMEIRSQFLDLQRVSVVPHSSTNIVMSTTSSPRSLKRWIPAPERLRQYRQQQKGPDQQRQSLDSTKFDDPKK